MQTIEEAMKVIREKGYEVGKPVDVRKYGPALIVSEIRLGTVIGRGMDEAAIQVYARSVSLLTSVSSIRRLVHEENLGSHILDLTSPVREVDSALDNASEVELGEMGLTTTKPDLNK